MKSNRNQATEGEAKAKPEVIKLGLDLHARQVTECRQLAGLTPKPAQKWDSWKLLDEVEEWIKAGIKVYSCRRNWAETQNNLGAAFRAQAARIESTKGAELLAQAVTAYRSALEVFTREQLLRSRSLRLLVSPRTDQTRSGKLRGGTTSAREPTQETSKDRSIGCTGAVR
jgi:hypothetical protein